MRFSSIQATAVLPPPERVSVWAWRQCSVSWLFAPRPRTDLHRLGPAALRPGLRLRRPALPLGRDRRFLLRCELDAAYFHLYGIARDDVDYIMDTFPIVRRKDEAQYGEYRTKRVILEIYDEMAEGTRTGRALPNSPRSAAG